MEVHPTGFASQQTETPLSIPFFIFCDDGGVRPNRPLSMAI
jgi:hypothetical protein